MWLITTLTVDCMDVNTARTFRWLTSWRSVWVKVATSSTTTAVNSSPSVGLTSSLYCALTTAFSTSDCSSGESVRLLASYWNLASNFRNVFLCFDAVGWVAGRASGLKKMSGGVLAWLSAWSEVLTCIWPSWCHCHSLSLASVKSRLVLPFWYRLTWVIPEKGR